MPAENTIPAMSDTRPVVRIESIEALLVDLPTIRPHKLAMTVMNGQTLVIVRVRCSDGIEGIGETTSIGGLAYGEQSPEGAKLAIDHYMAPLLIDQDATLVQATLARMGRQVQGQSHAKAAIETALLDAQGQRLGLPIHALLGGTAQTSLPVLWTLASGEAARDVDEALSLIEQRRHKVFKLKVGRRSVAEDVAHVAAIRKGLGEGVPLTVDVNQAWSEAQAFEGMAGLQDLGVALVEQPISGRNRRGMARLAARFDVPLMADEGFNDAQDAYDIAHSGAADILALKIAKAGGLWAAHKAAVVGEAAGLALYGGTMLEGSLGSIASAHVFAAGPALAWGTELFGPLLLKDDIVQTRPVFRDFALQLPTGPGLGLKLDEDKLAFYRRKA
jgi:muconate cycloisomerase